MSYTGWYYSDRSNKIEQVSEINKGQEKVIVQANEHSKNLEEVISIERAARLELQDLFNERSESFSWKITQPLRILEKLVDINRPFKASLIDGRHDATQSEIKVSRKIRWVKIKATGIQPSGFEIAVIAKNKKTSNRLTLLKLPVGDSETTWLVRIEPGYSEFWLNLW